MNRTLSCLMRLGLLAALVLAMAAAPLSAVAAGEEPESPAVYTVRPGDSLAAIAGRVYGDTSLWPAIYAANTRIIGPDPRLIRLGQTFRLPPVQDVEQVHGNGETMDVAGVASRLGLSVETVSRLRSDLGLTLQQLCEASPQEIASFFEELAKIGERTDHPAEAAAFRRLQLQDENGYIPPDGYTRAAAHMEVMANTPPPAAGLQATTS